ncbi:MAG: GNAT family N-acetyltransferase [Planctomycetota bacterium]
MIDPCLAQIGVSPGGIGLLYAVLALMLLFVMAVLLGFVLIGALQLNLGRYDRVVALRWPKRWVRIKPPVIKPFDELTRRQREAVFTVRTEVFLIEQGITEVPDQDGVDPGCHHVLAYAGWRVVGTARLQTREDGTVKVGRLAVLKPWRGRGVGGKILRSAHDYIDQLGVGGVMSAQQYLEGWYTSLGWVRRGEPYMEAGIPHVRMVYRASIVG